MRPDEREHSKSLVIFLASFQTLEMVPQTYKTFIIGANVSLLNFSVYFLDKITSQRRTVAVGLLTLLAMGYDQSPVLQCAHMYVPSPPPRVLAITEAACSRCLEGLKCSRRDAKAGGTGWEGTYKNRVWVISNRFPSHFTHRTTSAVHDSEADRSPCILYDI